MQFLTTLKNYLHISLLIFTAAAGAYAIYFTVDNKDTEMRQELAAQIELIDAELDWVGIEEAAAALFKSDQSDYSKIIYSQTRLQMAKQCAITPKCNSVYLLRENEKNQVIIMLNSSPPSNENHIEPNTIYYEATEPMRAAFKTKKTTIDNPAKDIYGYWQSAYTPHMLSDGTSVIIGFDIEADNWNQALWSAAAVPSLIVLGFLGVLMFYGYMWQGKVKQNEQLLSMQAELFKLSNEDSLTRLPNRRLFEDRLDRLLASAERTKEKFTLIYLDLDGFKKVNDTFGHQAGDKLLMVVAERLSMLCRVEDTVARLSGDEFALLLPRLESAEDAVQIAQKVIDAVAVPIALFDGEAKVTASLGVVIYSESYATRDKLLHSADMALYEAKKFGKNRYHLSDDIKASDIKMRETFT